MLAVLPAFPLLLRSGLDEQADAGDVALRSAAAGLSGRSGVWDPRRVWPLVGEKIPFLVLSLASGVLTFLTNNRSKRSVRWNRCHWSSAVKCAYFLCALRRQNGLARQSRSLLSPAGRMARRGVAGAALVLAGLSALAIYQARKAPYIAFGWFWYLGMLVPVIGIVQVGQQSMADRYSYLPLIGPVRGHRLVGGRNAGALAGDKELAGSGCHRGHGGLRGATWDRWATGETPPASSNMPWPSLAITRWRITISGSPCWTRETWLPQKAISRRRCD